MEDGEDVIQKMEEKSNKDPLASVKADFTLKLVLIGESNAGKTSLLSRYVDNTFSDNPSKTEELRYKMVSIDNSACKLQLWDTAGQEKYKTITKGFFRGARGIIVVFDISEMASFEGMKDWLQEANRFKEPNIDVKVIIVGNKKDLADKRVVSYEEVKKVADSNNAKYYEASAKTGEGVNEVFQQLVQDLLKTIPRNGSNPSPNPPIMNNPPKRKRCVII